MRVCLEPPYDVGFPWLIKADDGTQAVISSDTAGHLHISVGLPINTDRDYAGPVEITAELRARIHPGYKLSRKAARLLGLQP